MYFNRILKHVRYLPTKLSKLTKESQSVFAQNVYWLQRTGIPREGCCMLSSYED